MATLGMSATASVSSVGGSSTGSRGSKGRRYRTIANKSNVDENLFGDRTRSAPGNQKQLMPVEEINHGRSFSGGGKSKAKNNKEFINVITKDMIRKLRVVQEDPSGNTLIIPTSEFNRIQQASKVLTLEELNEQRDHAEAEKQKRMQDCEARKQHMQKLEFNRKKNEQLSDLEQEAKEKAQYLLQKAREQMEEQEDEIKKLNETILNAKCHAIRDAQLVEKLEIKKDNLEEDKRLDAMMEEERVRALKNSEEDVKDKTIRRMEGASILRTQIKHKEDAKMLDDERKEQETKERLRYLQRMQEEDIKELHKKIEQQEKMMHAVNDANQEMKDRKKLMKLQEDLEDRQQKQYLKEKAEREEQQEREKN